VVRYVQQGEPLKLPPDVFGRYASVQNVTRPVFARGYDSDVTAKTGVITGLDLASPAHAAGLRDGMRLLRPIAGTPGNAGVVYVLAVSDGGQERTITFFLRAR
jgi:predicted metalloprotease with PDZ domain